MANNKFYGYSPDASKEAEGNRLDRLNPYEFRKGMDYELTALGCSRLAESTLEEREKATESVLKNIQEHNGYYTSLITYETLHRNLEDKPTFKKWLAEQGESQMKDVDEKYTNDKMVELKETIKARVRKLMKEYANPEDEMMDKDDRDEAGGWMGADDVKDVHIGLGVNEDEEEEPSKNQVKSVGKETTVSVAKQIAGLQKDLEGGELKSMRSDLEKLEDERSKIFNKFSPFSEDPAKKAVEHTAYAKAVKSKQEEITATKEKIDVEESKINAEIEKLTDSLTTLQHEEKMGRRGVAATMMEKDTHLALLEIIKEAGVNMMEGAANVKVHYEIAKESYKEGFMAALENSKSKKK